MRIGVFGGSFDPVHIGHLIVAECCREQARLDRVLFVPVATQPHKQDRTLAPPPHRIEMLRLATGGNDAFDVSTIEIDRGGVSYTVETLTALATTHPADTLCLILGPDALTGLPTWREPARIVSTTEIVAVEREGVDDVAAIVAEPRLASLLGPAQAARIAASRVRVPTIGVRASDLRAATAAGHSIRYRTPRAVERYLESHAIYKA